MFPSQRPDFILSHVVKVQTDTKEDWIFKTLFEACHRKTDLKVFVVVTPEEGLPGEAPPILLLVRRQRP